MQVPSTASAIPYPDLQIQGFRGLKDLSVDHLSRVTLITGENNTGSPRFWKPCACTRKALRLLSYMTFFPFGKSTSGGRLTKKSAWTLRACFTSLRCSMGFRYSRNPLSRL